jgi:hypothetical protein
MAKRTIPPASDSHPSDPITSSTVRPHPACRPTIHHRTPPLGGVAAFPIQHRRRRLRTADWWDETRHGGKGIAHIRVGRGGGEISHEPRCWALSTM